MITPMPLFLPTGGSGGGPAPKWMIAILASVVVVVFTLLVFIIGDAFFDHVWYKAFWIKPAKEYASPEPYKIQYNPHTEKYVVSKKEPSGTYYMSYWMSIDDVEFFDLNEAVQFNDSAMAKGALKRYLEHTNFK